MKLQEKRRGEKELYTLGEVNNWLSNSVKFSHFITLHYSHPMLLPEAEKSIRHLQHLLSIKVVRERGKKTPRKLIENLRVFGSLEQSYLCKNSNRFDHFHVILEESSIDDNRLRSIIKDIWSKMNGTRPFKSTKIIKIIESNEGNNSICNVYQDDDLDFDSSQLNLIEGLTQTMEEGEEWFKEIKSQEGLIAYLLKDYRDTVPSELIVM